MLCVHIEFLLPRSDLLNYYSIHSLIMKIQQTSGFIQLILLLIRKINTFSNFANYQLLI